MLKTAVIVYADRKRRVRTNFAGATDRELLIRFGEVEAAIADMLCRERDEPHPLLAQMRAASIALARGDRAVLERLPPLPAEVCISVPEGYAYYDVSPDDYASAARSFFRELRPSQAVVIGIRSIGTSLSAAVAAVLVEAGCSVSSFTVRPRGHPFDRHVSLGQFHLNMAAHFLIVDEGPGLSGSSFAAVARKLGELGVPDHRIHLFPGWDADGSTFLSASARQQWMRHRRYVVVRDRFPGWRDLSAGKWRELSSVSAAVQPQHERRKYLRDSVLVKFEGLGDYGKVRFERAQQLWDAGFTPRPIAFHDGYLASEFVIAQPVLAADNDLVEWMRRYLKFLQVRFPSDREVPFDQNMEMIRVNVREGLGPAWAGRVESLERFRAAACDSATVQIDGRMLPHEFLQIGTGYVKTDTLDHHEDHFFPGCQDIAWDAAAVKMEFGLNDFTLPGLDARLPFYVIGYLSYRLGYCSMAAQSSPDAIAFRVLANNYAGRLRHEIGRLC